MTTGPSDALFTGDENFSFCTAGSATTSSSSMPSTINIVVDTPVVRIRSAGTDVESSILSGHVLLLLGEPTSLKDVKLSFKGKASLSDRTLTNRSNLQYTVISHKWSFLHGKPGSEHKLSAGRHVFPFQLPINDSLPSSIDSSAAAIRYKLRAHAVKPSFRFNHSLRASLVVPILRSFRSEAMEYQNTLDVESSWLGKLAYSVMIPHKAWAAGDKLTALVKLTPLAKGIKVLSVDAAIEEKIKIAPCKASAFAHPVRTVAEARYDISDEASNRVEEDFTCDFFRHISISIPSNVTPSHSLRPVFVSHKFLLHVLIANPDGSPSQLRCFFPLRILDHRLLQEARTFSAPARRAFSIASESCEGGDPCLEEDESFLPSYPAHVQDVVASMYFPESRFARLANDAGESQRRSSDAFVSQLSLSSCNVDQIGLENASAESKGVGNTEKRLLRWPRSLFSSRKSIGPCQNEEEGSPIRRRDQDEFGRRSYLSGAQSPSSSRPSSRCYSAWQRPGSSHSYASTTSTTSTFSSATASSSSSSTSVAEFFHRALSVTPEYAVAARGFMGGVPPLSSMQGLPSYQETVTISSVA